MSRFQVLAVLGIVALLATLAASTTPLIACDYGGGVATVSYGVPLGFARTTYAAPLQLAVDDCYQPQPVALAVGGYQRSVFLGATPAYGGGFVGVRQRAVFVPRRGLVVRAPFVRIGL